MKLLKKIFLLTVFSAIFTIVISTTATGKEVDSGKLWVGVGYGLSEAGMSNGWVAGIGAAGAVQSACYGAAAGACFGGPIGFGVGLGLSL